MCAAWSSVLPGCQQLNAEPFPALHATIHAIRPSRLERLVQDEALSDVLQDAR